MPTKGKKPDSSKKKISQPGLFERTGRKLDGAVVWIKERLDRGRSTYRSINGDYVKTIRKRKIFRILPPSLLVLLLFFVMVPFFAVQIYENSTLLWDATKVNKADTYKTLSNGEISQKIDGSEAWSNLSSISILVGTHARINDAEYEFLLKENGETIYSQVFSAAPLEDNTFYEIRFDNPVYLNKGSEHSFTISTIRASENNAIALYYDSEADMVLFRAKGKSDFYTFVIVVSIVFLAIFFIINLLINTGKIKGDIRYLACMLIYVIPLVFIYPVNTAPDEIYHTVSAFRLAQYDRSKDWAYNTTPHHDVQVPASGSCLTGVHRVPQWERIFECFAPSSDTSPMNIAKAIGPTRSMVTYAPAALGVVVGDLLSDSPMVIYYCGRLFNLLVVIGIVLFALSLVKKYRMILLSVILLPMFLQQSASYSYDAILNSLCILVIAYEIRFLTTDAIIARKRDICIIMLALILIGLIKPPYLVVATPLLFVDRKKFGKHKATKWLLIISALVMAVVAYVFDGQMITARMNGMVIPGEERGLSIETLLQHPYSAIKMFLRTLLSQGLLYITGIIGYFGWFDFQLDPFIIVMYIVFLVLVTFSNQGKFSKALRFWVIVAVVALVGSIFLAMYLSYTTDTAVIIEGVQGRYFLPAIPLIMLALMPKKRKIELRTDSCYAFLNLTTFCYVITLLVGFY